MISQCIANKCADPAVDRVWCDCLLFVEGLVQELSLKLSGCQKRTPDTIEANFGHIIDPLLGITFNHIRLASASQAMLKKSCMGSSSWSRVADTKLQMHSVCRLTCLSDDSLKGLLRLRHYWNTLCPASKGGTQQGRDPTRSCWDVWGVWRLTNSPCMFIADHWLQCL